MTMSPGPDLTRKVNQLDNDVGAICNMLNAILTTQQRHSNRLEEIGQEIGQISEATTEVSGAVTEVSGEIAEIHDDIGAISTGQVAQAETLDRILDLLTAGG
ncbi:MAG: hypothetical protein M3063_10530 [Actinomycetota bacterium]|nr:hypothetical protein [Actinomycetota bacterium]